MTRLRRAATLGLVAAVVTIGSGVLAFVAAGQYQQYGPPRVGANTVEWAARSPIYGTLGCTECHAAPTTIGTAHAALLCEVCHLPSIDHPGDVPGVVQALPPATNAQCVACHAEAAGRPAGFPEVDEARHFPGALCLACHDPHDATAVPPPEVIHPLVELPACTTCHAANGLATFPSDQEVAVDRVCLACHIPAGRS